MEKKKKIKDMISFETILDSQNNFINKYVLIP